jgi:ADP-dependent NAD(P)H-hydrate dehydratase / NAD(P)H-hydrate epimerase
MSLLVAGTIPVGVGETICGPVGRDGDGRLTVDGAPLPVCQGSSAMLSAALAVTDYLGTEPPTALLGGDIGRGEGTRAVYQRLRGEVEPASLRWSHSTTCSRSWRSCVTHSRGWRRWRLRSQTRLVADAGGMYAAKAAGLASHFDLMTPDVGEVGFLADECATHPAYVSHYLFGAEVSTRSSSCGSRMRAADPPVSC